MLPYIAKLFLPFIPSHPIIFSIAFICRVARMAEWLRLGMKHLVAGNLSGHTEKRPGWK
jgi:hypothetical protein